MGDKYDPDDWEKVNDILDVWFDSGSTHAFVLENDDNLSSPANLYLEGSDQHRGWFQSSLLESCGTRGVAPFEQVLTHGFVMDKDGRKMSKSYNNIIPLLSNEKELRKSVMKIVTNSQEPGEKLSLIHI